MYHTLGVGGFLRGKFPSTGKALYGKLFAVVGTASPRSVMIGQGFEFAVFFVRKEYSLYRKNAAAIASFGARGLKDLRGRGGC